MSELPSKYASGGLSDQESRQIITTGRPRKNRPIGCVKIEEQVNEALGHASYSSAERDIDGDIQLTGMDDENEVQVITDFVTAERTSNYSADPLWNPINSGDDQCGDKDLAPEVRPARETLMVVDTNFILSHLNIIDALSVLSTKYHHKIVIPIATVKELDGLKVCKRITDNDTIDGTTVGHLARWANSWIYQKLADLSSSVRAQKLREFIDKDAIKDDAILDCCLYLQEKEGALVMLLSNDKNLCMKALANQILTVSYRKGMTAELIAKTAFMENQSRFGRQELPIESQQPLQCDQETIRTRLGHHSNHQATPNTWRGQQPYSQDHSQSLHTERKHGEDITNLNTEPIESMEVDSAPIQSSTTSAPGPSGPQHLVHIEDFGQASAIIYHEVQKIVLDAIDYCMFEEYGEDVDMVGYDKLKVKRLSDSASIIIKFWISVFCEYFQRGVFKPFQEKKKKARYTEIPRDGVSLDKFVDYWSNVLRSLYLKRDHKQNVALEKIIERWNYITGSFK